MCSFVTLYNWVNNLTVQFLDCICQLSTGNCFEISTSLSLSLSLSLWLSIYVYSYAGKKGSTLSHGPRARGLKLDPEWPTLPIEASLQFSHWDPVTLPKILRHLNESLLNWQRTVQDIFNKTTITVHRQVKSGLRVERCLKLCFHMLNIKTSSSLVSHCRACKMFSGGAWPIVNNQSFVHSQDS